MDEATAPEPNDSTTARKYGRHAAFFNDTRDQEIQTRSALRRLAKRWLDEMGPSSNPRKLMAHPAFQEIVAFGAEAVPFLLREMQSRPSLLVWALPRITNANPVPPASQGKIAEMARAWVMWGRDNNYI